MPAKPTQPNKIKLDPVFVIPPGAEDIFVYSRDNADHDFSLDDGEGILDGDVQESVTDADSSDLGTPDEFEIVSQTPRRASGGVLVIDIVVSIDDVPGATDYDIQVVKA
jgi:hypothetical protein